ncbi:hypothetical protein HK100_001369 [Physocladia obscura]|uniref:Uncharacterized protein n=1 Tax=Physocladia obscura TaxID=109957 RepID=A0AAD5XBW0_9FUNG|nr:hypothetical protein HK100_001369 [Physocladia obscura]
MAGNVTIPGFDIRADTATAILNALKANSSTATTIEFSFKSTIQPYATAGTVFDFSSVGLTPDLLLKPEVGGIGGNVYSTISPFAAKNQGYLIPHAVYSGISMAARPARQGSGLVSAYNAAVVKTLILPTSISLNDTVNIKNSYKIAIYNKYTVDVQYSLAVLNAATFNPFIKNDDFTQDTSAAPYSGNFHTTVSLSSKIRVRSGKSANVAIQFILCVFGGIIV